MSWRGRQGYGTGRAAAGRVTTAKARQGTGSIRLVLGQRDRGVLDRFAAAVGIGKVRGPYFTQTRNGAPMYRWESGSREVVHLVCWLLWPWLSTEKRNQFHNAIEQYRTMVPTRKGE